MTGSEPTVSRSEARHSVLLEEVPEGYAEISLDGELLRINSELARMLGFASEQEALTSVRSFKSLIRDPRVRRSIFRKVEREPRVQAEVQLRTFHSEPLIARTVFRAKRDAAGQVAYVRVSVDDITAIRLAEKRLREAQEQAQFAFRSSPVPQLLAEYRTDGPVVVAANAAVEALLGYGPGEMVGLKSARFLPDAVVESEIASLSDPAAGQSRMTIETRRRHREGHWVEVRLTATAGLGPSGQQYVLIAMESIADQRREEALRSAVMETMAEGLLVVDEDGRFAYCNPASQRMLGWSRAELEGRLAHEAIHSRRADGSAYLPEDCPLVKVRETGTPLLGATDAFVTKDGGALPVGYSASPIFTGRGTGVVVVFRDNSDEVDRRASIERELATLSWISRIRDALANDRFELWAQPIEPVGEGVASSELLLRMRDTDGQIHLPGAFLPIAEQFGLVGTIDRWVVRRAIALAATGRRIEANLSAHSIGDQELLLLIESELQRTKADPSNLVVEITETAMMGDLDAGEQFARRLVELGCGLALDDFGTGFGSFTYVKRLPIRFLKIDIEFVRDIEHNAANRNLVRAIISLAKSFGFETIAEGVESEASLAVLKEEGVDYVQGTLIGPPALLS